jgi:hypothetical protein
MFRKKTKKLSDADKKMLKQAMPTSEILNGIVHMHPSVKRIKHPHHGFSLKWNNPENKQKKLFRSFSRNRDRILQLDEVGRRTIELIDDKNDVRTIANTVGEEFKFDNDKATAAMITFLTMLQKKNIIQISES